MQAGKVESFDSATGEGVLRLVHDGGAIPVRFAADVCRGIAPAPGVMVLVGLLGPDPGSGGPLSETFAMRAGLVEPDRGAGDIDVVHTMGISASRPGSRPGTLLVPFDEAAFPGLDDAFPEEVLGALALAPASSSTRPLPTQLRLLSGLLAVARRASRFRITPGEPPEGATFAGGSSADIGDCPWPKAKRGPALPVLQVSLEDARRIGLEDQINVFASGKDFSTLHVLLGKSGRRATIAKSYGEAAWLEFIDEVPVFPTRSGIEAAWRASGQPVPLDVDRFWSVEVGDASEPNASIGTYIAKHLPPVSELEADVVLGGFSASSGRGEEPFKRLATFFTPHFPWLLSLDEPRAALEVSFGDEVAALHGEGCLEPGFETRW